MNENKRKLIFGLWVTVLSIICLSTATYAWMTLASSIRVSDLELNVVTENALEIALDEDGQPSEEWTTVLSLGELIDPEASLAPATWSAQQDTFLSARYGMDGRTGGVDPLNLSTVNERFMVPVSAEAEGEAGTGYLIALDLWMRSGADQATVYLSEPAEQTEGVLGAGTWVIGEPVWNAAAVAHENGGNGAESVIRMGFRTYDEEYDTGGFVIYEPNASETETTTSVDGGALEGEGKLIRQAQSTWSEQNPVLRDNVNYEMGQFLTEDTGLFTLKNNVPRRFTLYIWLEGQDSGCDNTISAGKILANLQFDAETGRDLEHVYRPD